MVKKYLRVYVYRIVDEEIYAHPIIRETAKYWVIRNDFWWARSGTYISKKSKTWFGLFSAAQEKVKKVMNGKIVRSERVLEDYQRRVRRYKEEIANIKVGKDALEDGLDEVTIQSLLIRGGILRFQK